MKTEKKVFTDEAEYWVAKKIWDARVASVTTAVTDEAFCDPFSSNMVHDAKVRLKELAKELPVFDMPQKFSDRHPNLFITGLFAAVVAVAVLIAWILSSLGMA